MSWRHCSVDCYRHAHVRSGFRFQLFCNIGSRTHTVSLSQNVNFYHAYCPSAVICRPRHRILWLGAALYLRTYLASRRWETGGAISAQQSGSFSLYLTPRGPVVQPCKSHGEVLARSFLNMKARRRVPWLWTSTLQNPMSLPMSCRLRPISWLAIWRRPFMSWVVHIAQLSKHLLICSIGPSLRRAYYDIRDDQPRNGVS